MAPRFPSPGLILLVVTGIWGICAPAAAPSAAQIYRWTDESGQTHITDDPNQIPRSRGRQDPLPGPPALEPLPGRPTPEPLPSERLIVPRPDARAAVDALRELAALVRDEPALEDYAQRVALAGRTVEPAVAAIERGALRTALAGALACHREAAQLWGNQIAVRRGVSVALNMAPIRRAWECGAQKTAEAERLLAARR